MTEPQPYNPDYGKPLSTRERQVIELTAEGLALDGIAARLNIAASSTFTYRAKAYRKLGARNAAHAVALAAKRGELDLTREGA